MRIVIVAAGTWGDVRPNVVLGRALEQAGYEVLLVAAEHFRPWVRARGLPFAGLSADIQTILDALTNAPHFLAAIQTIRDLGPTALQMGREITAHVREGDALLLLETASALLHGAAEKHHARLIHVNLQPFAPTRAFSGMLPALSARMPGQDAYNHWAGQFVRRSNWWMMGQHGNAIRRKDLGLPRQTWAKHRALLDATPSLLLVSRHVLPPPDDWPPHHRVTGYLFDDDHTWQPPPDLLDFLAAGDKPVYVGFGSMRDRRPEATTRLVLKAVQRTGQRAVLLSGWAGLGAADLPPGVFPLDYAPHTWLFPQMAAVVHHGGAGTTAAGLAAGIPTVVVPIIGDQPFWGRRVHALGAGPQPIPHARLTAYNLAAAIEEATTSQPMREKAAELSQLIAAEDGVGQAVKTIQEFLG